MTGPIRTQEVRPPGGAEGRAVARVAVAIVAVWLLAAGPRPGRTAAGPLLWPYETSYASLGRGSPAWTLVRELRVAADEICALQAEERRWPAPERLAFDALPPFSPVLLVTGAIRYDWRTEDTAGVTSYLGRPARDPKLPALLLRFEPAPASHERALPLDDRHQRLPDGTIVHHSVWVLFPRGERAWPSLPIPASPATSGWKQVVAIRAGEVRKEHR